MYVFCYKVAIAVGMLIAIAIRIPVAIRPSVRVQSISSTYTCSLPPDPSPPFMQIVFALHGPRSAPPQTQSMRGILHKPNKQQAPCMYLSMFLPQNSCIRPEPECTTSASLNAQGSTEAQSNAKTCI